MQRGSKAPIIAKRSSLAGAQVNTHTHTPPQLQYLEHNKISTQESVQTYQITHTGFKDGSSSTVALYINSCSVCGFFLSWRGVPPQYCECSIWGCVGFYRIHTFLNPSVESQFKSFLKLIISFWYQHIISRQSLLSGQSRHTPLLLLVVLYLQLGQKGLLHNLLILVIQDNLG